MTEYKPYWNQDLILLQLVSFWEDRLRAWDLLGDARWDTSERLRPLAFLLSRRFVEAGDVAATWPFHLANYKVSLALEFVQSEMLDHRISGMIKRGLLDSPDLSSKSRVVGRKFFVTNHRVSNKGAAVLKAVRSGDLKVANDEFPSVAKAKTLKSIDIVVKRYTRYDPSQLLAALISEAQKARAVEENGYGAHRLTFHKVFDDDLRYARSFGRTLSEFSSH